MFVLATLLAGCVRGDVHVAGIWERQIEEYLVRLSFDGEENFVLQVGERSRSISGRYSMRGDVIVLVDDDCGDVEGKYRVEMQETSASFSVLNDACDGRQEVVDGEWLKVGN